jgi:hypothetical protein
MRILLFPTYFQNIENYTPIEDDLQQRKELTSLNNLTLQAVAPTKWRRRRRIQKEE